MALAAAVGVGDDEADPDRERDHAHQRGEAPEHAQRLVLGVDAEDRDRVAPHVGAHRGEQPRLARLRVGAHRDVVDRDQLLAGLDDRLQRVGELRDHQQLDRRLAVVGAKAGGRVRHRGRGGLAHDPRAEALERLLQRREVLDARHLAVADDHVGAPGEDRRDEPRDVRAVVLVVGVGVDDHVGAELQAGVEARLEAGREALVVGQAHDVVDAVRARHRDRLVGRAVVDDQPLDRRRSPRPRRAGRRASAGAARPRCKQGIWMMSFIGCLRKRTVVHRLRVGGQEGGPVAPPARSLPRGVVWRGACPCPDRLYAPWPAPR